MSSSTRMVANLIEKLGPRVLECAIFRLILSLSFDFSNSKVCAAHQNSSKLLQEFWECELKLKSKPQCCSAQNSSPPSSFIKRTQSANIEGDQHKFRKALFSLVRDLLHAVRNVHAFFCSRRAPPSLEV